jgi:lipoprotein-anchoring transpeptidase ErfK/SrfK
VSAEDWPVSSALDGKPGTVLIGDYPERIFMAPNATSKRRGTAEPRALLPWFAAEAGPGCNDPWLLVGPLAWVCSSAISHSSLPSVAAQSAPLLSADGLPFKYFKVGELGARAYASLADVDQGKVARELEPDFIVGVSRIVRFADLDFGLTGKGTWIATEELLPMKPSTFQGVQVNGPVTDFAWVRRDASALYSAPGKKKGGALNRRAVVQILEETDYHQEHWLRIAEGKWLPSDAVQRPSAPLPPAQLLPEERWIDVDLNSQILTAYQGSSAVFATLVSTGRGAEGTELATPKGTHRIWVKLRTTDMTNLENEEAQRYYAIEDVPYVMYFHAGYGLHGAFWHDSFGEVRSHGCVNLAPRDAQWLFYWASPKMPSGWSAVLPDPHDQGTLIVVR